SVRYYSVDLTGGTLSGPRVTLTVGSDEPATNPVDLRVARSTNNSSWTNADRTGGSTSLPYTVISGPTTIVATTYFAAASVGTDNPLPVELTKFVAVYDGKGVVLNWTTATETNNQGFIVSRSESKDGPFQQIASYQSNANLKGQGTTATETNYRLGDYSAALQSGKTYFYRLEDVNLTGQRNVLETKEVKLPDEYSLSQNYPNPFNPTTTINFTLKQDGKAMLEVYNILGQKVATLVNGDLKSGSYTYNWNAAGQATGVYFYRLVSGSFVQTKKMLLVK
ncbi:MAG: T9SS type A sorting domain-containing protein, partial [Chlorobiales bacterium]|nr:T9SS type A sorting domain-containing protein [Chlorobiales bacterium]